MVVEGVVYRRFVIRYTVSVDGRPRRRKMIRWSPGIPWIRMEIARELDSQYGIENIKPRSVSISN